MRLAEWMLPIEGRADGTYVVVTRNNAWGRGATLAIAMQNAHDAGGSLAKNNVIVAWQPNAKWRAVREIILAENQRPPNDMLPRCDEMGSVVGWGGGFETLHAPADAQKGR